MHGFCAEKKKVLRFVQSIDTKALKKKKNDIGSVKLTVSFVCLMKGFKTKDTNVMCSSLTCQTFVTKTSQNYFLHLTF